MRILAVSLPRHGGKKSDATGYIFMIYRIYVAVKKKKGEFGKKADAFCKNRALGGQKLQSCTVILRQKNFAVNLKSGEGCDIFEQKKAIE